MIIEGKYNTAKVFTEDIESGARGIIEAFCNSKVSEGSELCLMPDVHPAKGCCIGTVLKSDDIFPGFQCRAQCLHRSSETPPFT